LDFCKDMCFCTLRVYVFTSGVFTGHTIPFNCHRMHMHDTIQTLSKVESQWLPRGRGADVLSPDSKGPFLLDSDDIDVLEPSHPPGT